MCKEAVQRTSKIGDEMKNTQLYIKWYTVIIRQTIER